MAPPIINEGVNTIWVQHSSYLVFMMQLGFAFLEAGTIRFKNIHSILLKNIIDICVGAIFWWICGYAFAFGNSQGGFIGI